jgi:hypothetical protein
VWVSAYNAVGNGLPATGWGIVGSAPVRMLGLTRGSDYGYSMYEFEVYSAR